MDISNKTLALFLLGAIVVSLGGTILSLNKLGDLQTTGFVTQTGQVDLEINASLSITTEDNSEIDFGTCSPFPAVPGTINSENGLNTTAMCGAYAGDGIFVRNNGNVNVNITVQASNVGSVHGGTFLNATSNTSAIAHRTANEGNDSPFTGGCEGVVVGSYTNFTAINTPVLICSNLTFGALANSMETHVQIVVPHDVPVGPQSVTLTFTAEAN